MEWISASGLDGPAHSAAQLFDLASHLIPLEPSARPARSGEADERAAHLGPLSAGPVAGSVAGAEWALVALDGETDLLAAAAPLVRRRGGVSAALASPAQVLPFWRDQVATGLRALCIVGQGVPWEIQEQCQLDGTWTGRIPLDDPAQVQVYAERVSRRERSRVPLPRSAWIIGDDRDEFTRALGERLLSPVTAALARQGFTTTISRTPQDPPPAAVPGLVVLLLHGAAAPGLGDPVGLDDAAREALGRACQRGAFVVHLGCNGAGRSRGGRYGDLPARLYGRPCPGAAADEHSRFARWCLNEGAGAVLAHIDVTWSSAFATADPVVDFVEWLGSGRGTAAYAADTLLAEANRLARRAFVHHRQGDRIAAGQAWLRHLDLSGFVLLGDPAVAARWTLD